MERRPGVSIGGMLILVVRQLLQLTEEGTCRPGKEASGGGQQDRQALPPCQLLQELIGVSRK